MILKKLFLLSFSVVLFNAIQLKAQQAAHFLFAESQFKGLHVYDVIQDKEQNYYFATNDGLFKYDFVKFEKIEISDARSILIFNLNINKEGDVFFNNLNNQVFVYKSNKAKVFYELPESQNNTVITLNITEEDDLIIGAKYIYVVNKKGQLINEYSKASEYSASMKFNDNSIYFHKRSTDTMIIYSNGKFLEKKMKLMDNENLYLLDCINLNDSIYCMDISFKKLYYYNHLTSVLYPISNNTTLESIKGIRTYAINKKLWVAGSLKGMTQLNLRSFPNDLKFIYKDYLISDVYKDIEGNIMLSTFGKGIVVIPNIEIPDVIQSFKDDPVSILYKDTSGLYIGTSNGNILKHINGLTTHISKGGMRSIDVLKGHAKSPLVFFDNGEIKAYNKFTGEILNVYNASLKDVAFVNNKEFYFGTNIGVFKVNWNGKRGFELKKIDLLQYRIYALEYQESSKCLYVSTMNGVFKLTHDHQIEKITYQDKSIYPNNLVVKNDKVLASTINNGIMVIQGNSVSNIINPFVNNKVVQLIQLAEYKNSIIGRTSSGGIYQFDDKGKLIRNFSVDFGFNTKKVFSFSLFNNELWINHDGGVQKIDLKYQLPIINQPIVRIQHIFVNDSLINDLITNKFNYNQRKFEFILTCPTIKYQQNVIYHYQLVGYHKSWQTNLYFENRIIFNALAPGKYSLKVKADIQGIESEVATYDFEIERPFYLNNWFVFSVLCLFLSGVYLVYRLQINNQRLKSKRMNELNASKLTAIKSQMNPHFIFNSLNSIQDLILKGDVENSYSYITTFSDLVRRTLNYSEKEFIEFDEEIQLLELYLSLEKLRFKKDFTYSIHINFKDDFLIPPMLIQPFVENALIHGLLHKEGAKNLIISFDYIDKLICTIEDNGVGRQKSQEIKIRQKSHHESFSNIAIRKRFQILSEIFEGQYGYSYQDLKQGDIGIGTIVTLSIPVKTKY